MKTKLEHWRTCSSIFSVHFGLIEILKKNAFICEQIKIPYVFTSISFVPLLMYFNIWYRNFSSSKSSSSRDRHNHSRDKDKHKHSSSNSSSRDKKRSRDDSRDGHRSSKKARYYTHLKIRRPFNSFLQKKNSSNDWFVCFVPLQQMNYHFRIISI